MTLILADVIHATGADVVHLSSNGQRRDNGLSAADLERALGEFTSDSRTVSAGGVFVALQGERVDGHAFLQTVFQSGARAAMVSRRFPVPEPVLDTLRSRERRDRAYLLLVDDPAKALQDLAAFWRSRFHAEIVGITGSIGKTTTKEIVTSVLGHSLCVLKNPGNLNTEIGLPLTLLRMGREHELAVLEMGMYGIGDIALLAEIARPRIGVVTNIAPVHLERVGTIDRVAQAKGELVAALPENGLAVLNGDDRWTRAMAEMSGAAKSVLVGLAPDCDYRALEVAARGLDGVSFTLQAEGHTMPLRTRVPGAHTAHAFLAAIAVARELGMAWEMIRDAVAEATLDVRQRLLYPRADMLVIDDSYNAAPQSMTAALELLAAAPGEKIAVLGDMLELGEYEEVSHREVGEQAAPVSDWLVLRGSRCQWIAEAALAAGFNRDRIIRTESNRAAADAVLRITSSVPAAAGGPASGSASTSFPTMPWNSKTGEPSSQTRWSVLIKGSRGIGMEEIVEILRSSGAGGA